MSPKLRNLLIGLLAVVVLAYLGLQLMQHNTKRHSPEEVVKHTAGERVMEVRYSRPYKKGRAIFGGLVPYDQVWRTGANEATTFTTSAPVRFGDVRVPAGTYTLWTIPGPDRWKVILNSRRYGWGVTWGGVASREAAYDVAQATVPVQRQQPPLEQFTIAFRHDPQALTLAWDDVRVEVPLE